MTAAFIIGVIAALAAVCYEACQEDGNEVTEFTPDGLVRCRTLEGKCRTIGAWKPEDLVKCERGGAA